LKVAKLFFSTAHVESTPRVYLVLSSNVTRSIWNKVVYQDISRFPPTAT